MGCCSNSSSAKYDYDMKSRTISKKNIDTLEKYGQGAAARNYTKNMKQEAIKEITQLKKPCYKDGSRRPEDSTECLVSDKKLKEMLNEGYSDLAWNNYFEDVGEGRKYQGQWTKPK